MAATKYEIYCKYYHSSINKVVNNTTTVKWVQAEDSGAVPRNVDRASSLPGIENCWVRPEDGLNNDYNGTKRRAAVTIDNNLYSIMTSEISHENPKYDMIFVYDGIISTKGEEKRNKETGDIATAPVVYYERMKRLDMTPWFLYATCASLNVAMAKAGELVNLIGKENVIIGKVVSLDQYIEIV